MSGMRLVSEIEAALRGAGTPDRAVNEKRYLKSDLEHFGVRVPEIRRITKRSLKQAGALEPAELVELIERLWDRPVHEMRMAAVEVVNARSVDLSESDIGLLEHMLRTSGTWALVDGLAVRGTQQLLERHPEEEAILDRWATDDNFWIRRSALLVHLGPLSSGAGDWERFGRYADAMLDDKEFFIRKAIGWVLRETAKKRHDMVFEWIHPRAQRASGVTIREVVKRLSPEQVAAIQAARS